MNKKYILTNETKEYRGYILHCIERVSDNLIGGWIENENNLSQCGDCFVYGNGIVCGNGRLTTDIVNLTGLLFPISIVDNGLSIGCRWFTFTQIKKLTNKQIAEIDNKALQFKKQFGPTIKQLLKALGKI